MDNRVSSISFGNDGFSINNGAAHLPYNEAKGAIAVVSDDLDETFHTGPDGKIIHVKVHSHHHHAMSMRRLNL